MNSQASDHASSSSTGGSGGTAVFLQEFLSIEGDLKNFERNYYECFRRRITEDSLMWEGVLEVVQNLRKYLGAASDGSQILETWNKYYGDITWGDASSFFFATPLHWVVLMDDRAMVKTTLQSGKVDVNAKMGHPPAYTALHLALYCENFDFVKILLEHGATTNIGDDFFRFGGLRSLVKNFDVFTMIFNELPQTAVDFHDAQGHTALQDAAGEEAVPVSDDADKTALHYAAMQGTKPVVENLLDRNVDINLRDNDGRTALHNAAINGAMPVLQYLVGRNANINCLDQEGRTALHYAIIMQQLHVVKYLVEHNADVDIKDMYRKSPILYSIRSGHMDIFTYILARVTILHDEDENGNNALHYAVEAYDKRRGEIGIVKRLREVDVDMNARNKAGYSPFFAAVLEGHTEVVKELLISKEKIRVMEECKGKTPIQIAYDNDKEHIQRALLECDDVSRYMETLYRDRQVYVDAANAILVGAALIASVTFASWLQPPLGYTSYFGESYANSNPTPSSTDLNYADVQHNKLLRVFWVFNCLSFYFAIATVVFGARSVLPRNKLFIKVTVEKLRLNLLWTSILLACAVSFVIVAFGIAGCIVLTPLLKFQWYMIGPTIFGGVVCLVCLAFLFKSMLEDVLRKKSGRSNVYWFEEEISKMSFN